MLPCALCHKTNTNYYHTVNKFAYYVCSSCNTLFLHPQPTKQFLQKYYQKNFEYNVTPSQEQLIRKRATAIISKLKKMNPDGRMILDIGSGYGYFLDEAQKQGLDTTGIEPSALLTKTSIKHLIKVNIFRGALDDYWKKYRHNDNKFDFITLIHVIEHIKKPSEMIQQAFDMLDKNGVLYIETPNLDSHLFNAEQHSYTFLTPPDHLWIFSNLSLTTIMKPFSLHIASICTRTFSLPEHFMGVIKNVLNKPMREHLSINNSKRTKEVEKNVLRKYNPLKLVTYFIFDKCIAHLLYRLMNISNKGSILELYIKKK